MHPFTKLLALLWILAFRFASCDDLTLSGQLDSMSQQLGAILSYDILRNVTVSLYACDSEVNVVFTLPEEDHDLIMHSVVVPTTKNMTAFSWSVSTNYTPDEDCRYVGLANQTNLMSAAVVNSVQEFVDLQNEQESSDESSRSQHVDSQHNNANWYQIGKATMHAWKRCGGTLNKKVYVYSDDQGMCHTTTPKNKSVKAWLSIASQYSILLITLWPHHACRKGGSKTFTVSPGSKGRCITRDTYSLKMSKGTLCQPRVGAYC